LGNVAGTKPHLHSPEPSDADIIYVAGPGHGGPSLNANSYLEGSYTEVHSEITPDENGIRLLFRKFSTPGGIPSHCGPHVPNSMHGGRELGYSLVVLMLCWVFTRDGLALCARMKRCCGHPYESSCERLSTTIFIRGFLHKKTGRQFDLPAG